MTRSTNEDGKINQLTIINQLYHTKIHFNRLDLKKMKFAYLICFLKNSLFVLLTYIKPCLHNCIMKMLF